MKKTPKKLVLHSDTLRMLDNMDLARAVGGLESGNVNCPHAPAADTGRVDCEAPAIVIATAVCG